MNTRTKVIISAALLALLTAPASARTDGDEGGASAYPRFTKERTYMVDGGRSFGAARAQLVNRPSVRR